MRAGGSRGLGWFVRRVLGVCVVAGALLTGMIATHPFYPGVEVSYVASEPGVDGYAWDTGYGFNKYQRQTFDPGAWGFAQALDARLMEGAVRVELTLDSMTEKETPWVIGGGVAPTVREEEGKTVVDLGIEAGQRVGVIAVPNNRGLRRVRVVDGLGSGAETDVQIPAGKLWGQPRIVLVDRRRGVSGGGMVGLSSVYPVLMDPRWQRMPLLRAVAFHKMGTDGGEKANGGVGGYRVAVVHTTERCEVVECGAAGVVEGLQEGGGGGEWFSAKLDLKGFARAVHPLRLAVQVVMALVLSIGIVGLCTAGWARRETLLDDVAGAVRRRRGFFVRFGLLCLWFGVWIIGEWPGLLGSDSFTPIAGVDNMQVSLWYSIAWPLWYMGLDQAWLGVSGVVVVQTLACAGVVAGVLEWCRGRGAAAWIVNATMLVVMLSPAVVAYNVFHDRNALVSVAAVGSVVCVFGLVLRRVYEGAEKLEWRKLWWLGLLLGAPPLFRVDNLVLSLAGLAVLMGFGVAARVRTVVVGVLMLGVVGSVTGPLTRVVALNADMDVKRYQVAAMVQPMAGLYFAGYHTRTRDADYAVIDRVMSREVIKNSYFPEHIGWYWEKDNGWFRTYSDDDIRAFRKLLLRAAWENPEIYLGQRTRALVSLLIPPALSDLYEDARAEERRQTQLRNLGVLCESGVHDALYGVEAPLLERTRPYWTTAPQFALLFLVIFMYRWLPVSAAAAAMLVPRIGVMFLLAPATAFFYLYDLHLFGILLPMLVAVELAARRRVIAGNAITSPARPRALV